MEIHRNTPSAHPLSGALNSSAREQGQKSAGEERQAASYYTREAIFNGLVAAAPLDSHPFRAASYVHTMTPNTLSVGLCLLGTKMVSPRCKIEDNYITKALSKEVEAHLKLLRFQQLHPNFLEPGLTNLAHREKEGGREGGREGEKEREMLTWRDTY